MSIFCVVCQKQLTFEEAIKISCFDFVFVCSEHEHLKAELNEKTQKQVMNLFLENQNFSMDDNQNVNHKKTA